jgi:hypothetical protein
MAASTRRVVIAVQHMHQRGTPPLTPEDPKPLPTGDTPVNPRNLENLAKLTNPENWTR